MDECKLLLPGADAAELCAREPAVLAAGGAARAEAAAATVR